MNNTTPTEDKQAETAMRVRDDSPHECYEAITELYFMAQRLDKELDMANERIRELEQELVETEIALREAGERD